MSRTAALLARLTLIIAGVLLAIFGLFAITYEGDSGEGDTYIRFGTDKIDADLVGGIALVVALLSILVAMKCLMRGRAPK
jgi:hypothetical protein